MAKVAVVIRQLPGNRPVTSAVIKDDSSSCRHEVDNIEGYLTSRAKDHIEEFKNKLVEFTKAEFWIDITEM